MADRINLGTSGSLFHTSNINLYLGKIDDSGPLEFIKKFFTKRFTRLFLCGTIQLSTDTDLENKMFTTAELKRAKAKKGQGKYKAELVKELQFAEAELNSMIIQNAPETEIALKRIANKCLRDAIVDLLADY